MDADGIYAGRPDVELWDVKRDARSYPGPWPVVAHPPCERWGRFWWATGDAEPGSDGGCFAAALAAVERWGGVLEHPAFSYAWRAFNLPEPSSAGGWIGSLWRPGRACHVDQGSYGHRMRKGTWLYYVGSEPAQLRWGASSSRAYLVPPRWARRDPSRPFERVNEREARATPPTFADELVSLARSSYRPSLETIRTGQDGGR